MSNRTGSARRVLITGGGGQLAQALASIHSQARAMGFQLNLAQKSALDITKADGLGSYLDHHQPDAVINTAAYTHVELAENHPALAHEVNALGPELLARACRKRGIALLHMSTDYVFDGSKVTAWTESDSVSPLNVYGKTKLAGELAAQYEHPDAIVVRTSWVFSEFGRNFMKSILQLASSQPALRIVSDQYGTPTYAPHLALALLKILQHYFSTRDSGGRIYQFAGSPTVNWYGFAQEIVRLAYQQGRLGRLPRLEPVAAASYMHAASRPTHSSLSAANLERLVGTLQRDWRQGIAQTLSVNP